MRSWGLDALRVFEAGILVYFVAINTTYLVFTVVAFFQLRDHRRRWTPRALDSVLQSAATPAVSLVVAAYNEEATIQRSLRSLLSLAYPEFEVIVVNDGSKDGTLAALLEGFDLVPAPLSYQRPLPSQAVRGVYRSLTHEGLVAVDKARGGKADAINAGINAARYPLVCVIDADSLLEDKALLRAVVPFLEDPATVAVGGTIRILNGCTVDAGRVTHVGVPQGLLARFQVVEYLRAFLSGRVAQSAFNSLLLISGAFGMFRRDAILAVGGFRHDTVGEDMEIVCRLHRHFRDRHEPCRVVFQPDSVCWTEAPESLRILRNQRNRWQRGAMEVLSYHFGMLGRPRYGAVGMFGMPYYLLFEAAGPLVEAAGYAITIVAVAFGVIEREFAVLLFIAAVLYGVLISLAAVLLEEVFYRRYPRIRDLLLLVGISVVENFGYRQLTTWWRLVGAVDFFRKKEGWGQ